MKKYRALSLITAAVMWAVLTSCEYGYASDRKKKETSSAVSEQKEKAEKVSDKYENIDIEEVNDHVRTLLDHLKESGNEKKLEKDIEVLMQDMDAAEEAYAYSEIAYDSDWYNERLEEEYDACGENYYVVYEALSFAFSRGYATEEYKELFAPYIVEENLEYYNDKAMSLKRAEGYARVDYQVSDEYLDEYYDISYDEDMSEKDKNLKCAEIYLDILSSYDTDTFYDSYNRDYTPEDVLKLSDTIKEYFIPLSDELLDRFYDNKHSDDVFDSPVTFKEPFSTIQQYAEKLSPDIKKSADKIIDDGLFTIAKGDECYTGSYTIDLPVENSALVFIYNDDSFYDMQTAIHEFGHFHSSFYDETPSFLEEPNLDVAEIQSQAMELLFMQFYDEMYGSQSDAMKLYKAYDFVDTVIQGFLIGEFEYTVLRERDNLSADDVVKCYEDIMGEYADSYPLYYIDHIFSQPGYYVSYGTSALAALDILDDCVNDTGKALEKYEKMSKQPSNSPDCRFRAALSECGFEDVMNEEYIAKLSDEILAFADSIK